jgi:hypothetical protein
MRRLVSLAVPTALVLALAACGGDDAGGALSTDEWCERAENINALSDDLDAVDPFDPEGIEAAYTQFRSAVDAVRGVAPDEIRDDVETLYQGVADIDDALADADYSFLDVDLSFMSGREGDMDTASERVRSYNVRECGFDERDGDSTDDAFDFGAGSARDQLVEEFVASGFTEVEARCIADNLAIETLGADDEAAIFEVFDTCDISLERLGELGG